VRDLILELRDAGKTVFFSSHILQDAEMICDRVAILKHGRLLRVGRLDDLVSHNVNWFEVSIRGELPADAPGTVLSRDGEVSLIRVPDVEALGCLLALAQCSGAQPVSVWPHRDTLEDLFLREIAAPGRAERQG